MAKPDPFNTEKPISQRGMSTFRTIAGRLAAVHPPIFLEYHIADKPSGDKQVSTLEALDSTLDGINFVAKDPKLLARAFDTIRDSMGNLVLTSMKEDPDHWALKASFGKTVGTGWREPWRPRGYASPASVPSQPRSGSDLFRMRFGTAGTPIRFTALHCAVDEVNGGCNIHIDESGFVLAMPDGVSLTPDLYDHFMNELLLKTDFRDWLVGLVSNDTAAAIIREVIRRTSFQFPNAANRYAGLEGKVNSIRRPGGPGDLLLTVGRLLAPTGMTFDVYDREDFKVQVTGTVHGGNRTIAVTVGGNWD